MPKRTIFTVEVLDAIKVMVADGLGPELIADKVGSTVGSLKVTCSKKGISLRHPNRKPPQPKPAEPQLPVPVVPMTALQLSISRLAMMRLQKQATDKGLSAIKLAADLLEIITTDRLYDAVLDNA
jgi:hypothetical protein